MATLEYENPEDLAHYIELHQIRVISYSEASITVESLYSKDGNALYVEETIDATWQAVRDYLGY